MFDPLRGDGESAFTRPKDTQFVGSRQDTSQLAYDGLNPMRPMFCYLKPYYNDPNESYFRQIAQGEL
jgi:hypothetical protein